MATSRCNARHDGVTEVEDLVLKGLERSWKALDILEQFCIVRRIFVDFVPFSASSMLLCSWAWSSSSSALLYSSLSCKLMRLLSPEILSCHSTTMCFHLRKTDPILDMGENRWECWELNWVSSKAFTPSASFCDCSRHSLCNRVWLPGVPLHRKEFVSSDLMKIGYLPPNIAQYVCFKIFRKWSLPTNVIEQSRCFPIWLLRSATKAGK